jgi:hypothetical protein
VILSALTEDQIELIRQMLAEGRGKQAIGDALWPELPTSEARRKRAARAIARLAGAEVPDEEPTPTNKPSYPESVVESGDKRDFTKVVDAPVRSLADLVKVCQIDQAEWKIVRWSANKWEMGYKDAQKQPGSLPLYQVKATMERKVEEVNARAALLSTLKLIEDRAPSYAPIQRATPNDEYLLELTLPDVHVGKLAWGVECGEDYDLRIAESVFRDATAELIERARSYPVSRIVFPIGNDLLNCDSPAGNTTSGTPQSNDGRYQKAYQKTLQLLVWAIDELREIAPVDVLTVPGNHDTLSAWTLSEALAAWYRRDEEVSVENGPALRKYYRWGRTLLGFTHGDKEKPGDLPLLMASEKPCEWAATDFREWHLGHLHMSRAQIKTVGSEFHGVRVRTLPSLCATDAWHHQQGYTGNLRSAEAYLYHRERGHAATLLYTLAKSPKGGAS